MVRYKKLILFFSNLKIRKKLIGTYVIVVLIPVLMVGVILTSGMKNMAIEQAMKEADINTDRLQTRLVEKLKEVTDVSERLYYNTNLDNLITTDYESTLDVVVAYSGFKEFDDLMRTYGVIDDINIYVTNNMMLENGQFQVVDEEISETDWYKDAIRRNGAIYWQYLYDEKGREYNLCLTRLVMNEYYTNLGVLVIRVSNNYLSSIIEEEPFVIIAAIDGGMAVVANDGTLSGSNISARGLSLPTVGTAKSIVEVNYNNMLSKVITNAFSPPKCRNIFYVFTIVPIKAITYKSDIISLQSFGIIGVSLVISIMLLLFFSSLFSNRIIKLRREMKKVVEGNFELAETINGKDEVGELYQDLLAMVTSFKQLIYEVYEERLLKEQLRNKQSEIEFKMLANQINPHFLYNVLETIRMRAHSKGDSEIAGVVKMLARIMRRNLEATSKMVSLQSEIDLVKDYLEIQKFRYEERISFEVSIKVDINNYLILPLLLQPVVENAFIHGLEGRRRHGHIEIVVEETEGLMFITVHDNGTGMDANRLVQVEELLEDNSSDVRTSIGLRNVNSRIKLYYGCDYGLKLSSVLNEGTTVCIYLPWKEAV